MTKSKAASRQREDQKLSLSVPEPIPGVGESPPQPSGSGAAATASERPAPQDRPPSAPASAGCDGAGDQENGQDVQDGQDAHSDSTPGGRRERRRPRRRELHCPLHPEQRLFSVSPKHHLYLTDVGQLMIRGLSKRRADELLAAYKRVLPLTNEWIECFWCEDCATSTWWHVTRHDRTAHSLAPVSRELWEQASGVIRAEGNPSVSQFSRRQARAAGVHGLRQYRFL